VQDFIGIARRKRLLGRPRSMWENGIKSTLRRSFGVCGVDSPGSGQGSVAGCCECGDELSSSSATDLFRC
jgi:hypothetical protein